jgi:hypothetical protein
MARPRFDAKRDFVAAKAFPFNGQQLQAGDPFPKDGVPGYKLGTLYGARMINFAPEAEAPVDPVQVQGGDGGWFTVTAPWLEEPIKVRGTARANREADKLRREGEPPYHHGVAIHEGENGWWAVEADWMDEAEKVHGEEAARARAAELRAEGPPPDPRTSPTVTPPAEEGGMFIVNAPWLEEAVEFSDGTDAEAHLIALRDAGPPDGWEPAPPPAE